MKKPGPELVPCRRLQVHTRDRDAAAERIRQAYGCVHLDIAGPFEWRSTFVDLGPILVTQGECNAAVSIDMAPPTYALSLSSGSALQLVSRGETAEVAPGRGVGVLSPGARSMWKAGGAFHSASLRIEPRFLTSQLEALTGEIVSEAIVFALSMPTHAGAGSYVERLCHFLAAEIDRSAALDHPNVAAGLLESLVRALLTSQPHNHAGMLDRPAPPSSATIVRRVEEYIDTHAWGPITMAELAAVADVSVRSLDAAFQLHRRSTPGAFLRSRRLLRARHRLLTDLEVSVSTIGYAAGFARPETFEIEYAKVFGERPEETRHRGFLSAGAPPEEGELPPPSDRIALLSPREREVCACVAEGMLSKQIAARLGLSEQTVKQHRSRAMAKLGARSSPEMAAMFRKAGR